MSARMWYVLEAFIPATRILTGPPPGCDHVSRPYEVSGPNSIFTLPPSGTTIEYWATNGLLVAETVPGPWNQTVAIAVLAGCPIICATMVIEIGRASCRERVDVVVDAESLNGRSDA